MKKYRIQIDGFVDFILAKSYTEATFMAQTRFKGHRITSIELWNGGR